MAAALIEDKGSGTSLIQELREGVNAGGRKTHVPVIPCDPKGVNKIACFTGNKPTLRQFIILNA